MTLTTQDRIIYSNAMSAMRASGWRVNTTDYHGVVVETCPDDSHGDCGVIDHPVGWAMADMDRIQFRTIEDAEGWMKAYWLDQQPGRSGTLDRWNRRFLQSRGFKVYCGWAEPINAAA